MTTMDWTLLNQECLSAEMAEVRFFLEAHIEGKPAANIPVHDKSISSSLSILTRSLGLTPFEKRILVLCAGVELDSKFPSLCAKAQGDAARTFPTLGLALAAFPDAHWSAVNPAAPLRRLRLVEVAAQSGGPLTSAAIKLDERLLHYLTGIQYLDERLVPMLEPLHGVHDLTPSQRELADHIASLWSREEGSAPLIELLGSDETTRRAIGASAASSLGLQLYSISSEMVPANGAELEGFLRLWERETVLSPTALMIEAEDSLQGPSLRLAERVGGAVLASCRSRSRWRRPVSNFEVRKPSRSEQVELWKRSLGDTGASLNGFVSRLVSQFDMNPASIRRSAASALEGSDERTLEDRTWEASRMQSRPRLDDLAQRIEPMARWDDLVLPESERQQLREIGAHLSQRTRVFEEWGFFRQGSRGLGISALFSGASGTGKTMAAEVLANELRLDLYRIDLAGVVSKYIGETEKNLRRVFDAAEEAGAILFFDEADALFGKRSEVKDSHDRYANIEINYLLQRMESYRGLAILATNMKSALDPAFLRRLRFVLNFPFPDAFLRGQIWERIFPDSVPLDRVDFGQLARLQLSGGNIRNIALHAAFLAAGANEPVGMPHLARAAKVEFAKMERPFNEADIGGWK